MKNNLRKQACSAQDRLSKVSFLAMLYSNIDETRVLEIATGKVISLTERTRRSDYEQALLEENLQSGAWVYYEQELPRRLFIANPNWSIASFDPATRNVCISMVTGSGTRVFNMTLPKTYGRRD